MNVLNKVALQGLRNSRTRTLVTVIGVILSAAMITAVTTFGISLLSYLTEGAAQKYGDWYVGFADVPASFVQEQAADERVVESTSFENIGYARLEGSKNADKPYLFIAGLSDEALKMLPVRLFSGRMPENSGEVIVSASVSANAGVKVAVGDTLTLDVGSRVSGGETLNQHDPYRYADETFVACGQRTFTVVGICQRPAFEERTAPGYTVITKADVSSSLQRLLGNLPQTFVSSIPAYTDSYSLFVKLKSPGSVRAYANETAGKYAHFFNDDVLRFTGASDAGLLTTLLYAVSAIVIIIIMIGSVFLIYNAFNISLSERTHQFGILMSVGATEKQLLGSVLFEGFCIGIMGIPLGVLLGYGSMGAVLNVVSRNFQNIMYDGVPLTITLSVPAIAAAAVISMITILISAYIPARRAAGMPVMECIRQTNEIKVEAKAVKTGRLAHRVYGLEGTLALKNFKRNKRRYRSIVLSLALSVVLFIATNSFVTCMQQASEMAGIFTTYDIALIAPDMDDRVLLSLYDKMKSLEGITSGTYQAQEMYTCRVSQDELSDVYWEKYERPTSGGDVELELEFYFVSDDVYLNQVRALGLPEEEYMGEGAKLIAIARMDVESTGRSHEIDDFKEMFVSGEMEFVITPENDGSAEHARSVRITSCGFVPPDTLRVFDTREAPGYIFQALAPYSRKAELIAPDMQTDVKGLTFSSDQCSRSAALMEEIIMGEGITDSYNLLNLGKLMEESKNMIFIANVFCYIFIIMISLIAVANVFNTISTNIKLRKRELAMLRSVGMSERSFQRMMNFECVFYGMQALLAGLPLAMLASWLVYRGMRAGGADAIDFVMPWGPMAISIGSVLLIVFVTMLYAVSRIRRENIIDALRDELE